MTTIHQEIFDYNGKTVTLETGKMARQCHSVTIKCEKTIILATVVGAKEPAENPSFFPLSVNYQEKYYSVGKIPGGFLKREGRPSEREILTSRLIDRSVRPLFPENFMNNVQVICTVLSTDKNEDKEVLAILAASAALSISDLPFEGPVAACKISYLANEYVVNPSRSQIKQSPLEMVVSGTKDAIMMVESGASELSEKIMLDAIQMAHESMQLAIESIQKLAKKVATPKLEIVQAPDNSELKSSIASKFSQKIEEVFKVKDKLERQTASKNLKKEVLEYFENNRPETYDYEPDAIKKALSSLEKNHLRQSILSGQPRIDGRGTTDVRPINTEINLLPGAHGSSLFTRGETQALASVTLGALSNGQLIDDLEDVRHDHFMLHYNFPGFCVGEIVQNMSPKRREIGHGNLARRAIQPMLPEEESFPYTIRIVSEILESNGSSSMATVCASSMSLMNAGVPINGPVAGIAMGLMKEDENVVILTDILGDEDHLGDMDFKVAGTSMGITALQMDIKIKGISVEIMQKALSQAKEAREHILGEMKKTISASSTNVSDGAPQFCQVKIHPQKISALIGKGGANIKKIIEQRQVEIDVGQDGLVKIYGTTSEQVELAEEDVKSYVFEPKVGEVYSGIVKNITKFGAFVEIKPNIEGLVHVSEIAEERVENVEDYLKSGQSVQVKLIQIDDKRRLKLSIKQADFIPFPEEGDDTSTE